MSWLATNSTATLSPMGRKIFIRKAEDLIDRLERIRARVVADLTLHQTTTLATKIPLPEADEPDTWMWEPRDSEIRSADPLEESPIEGSWLELLYLAPDPQHAFEYLEVVTADEGLDRSEGFSSAAEAQSSALVVTADEGLDRSEAFPSAAEARSSALVDEALHDTASQEACHVLVSPEPECLSGNVEPFLDPLDEKTSCYAVSSGSEPFTDAGLYPAAGSCKMSTEGILQLVRDLDESYRFRYILARSIQNAHSASSRCFSRTRRRSFRGYPRRWMKSLGYGSPLADSIAADEEWPAEGWDSQNDRGRRWGLHGRVKLISSTDEEDYGF